MTRSDSTLSEVALSRWRCTNTECTEYEQFLAPSDVVWVEVFDAHYHAYDQQGMLLDAALAGSPLPCGPVCEIVGPCRIRLRRKKGWRKPADAVTVTRPTKWGNPFIVGEMHPFAGRPMSLEDVLELYESWITIAMRSVCDLDELRGRDLACWCRLEDPCHADVLLEMANG